MGILLEIGIAATLGFGTDPQRVQDTQRPYLLIEAPINSEYVLKAYHENKIINFDTTEYFGHIELSTAKSGFNYALGTQTDYEMNKRTTKTGNTIYLKVFYRFTGE